MSNNRNDGELSRFSTVMGVVQELYLVDGQGQRD